MILTRKYSDSDGRCFADFNGAECLATEGYVKECRTYLCPFYKPQGCKDWVKLEHADYIEMIPPEDYFGAEKLAVIKAIAKNYGHK